MHVFGTTELGEDMARAVQQVQRRARRRAARAVRREADPLVRARERAKLAAYHARRAADPSIRERENERRRERYAADPAHYLREVQR